MGEGTSQAVEVIGSVAKKAKDAVMVPIHGAFALAKAVVGGDERNEERDEPPRPRGKQPPTSTRPTDAADSPGTTTLSTPTTSGTPQTGEAGDTEDDEAEEPQQVEATLDDIWGVGESRAEDLREAGFESVRDVADASVDALTEVSGIGDSTAEKMIDSASELLEG